MLRRVRICVVARSMQQDVYIVAVPDGSVSSRWHAHRAINALRTKLPLERITADIVVLTGERSDLIAAGSSPDVEAFVQRLVPELASYRWEVKELDW